MLLAVPVDRNSVQVNRELPATRDGRNTNLLHSRLCVHTCVYVPECVLPLVLVLFSEALQPLAYIGQARHWSHDVRHWPSVCLCWLRVESQCAGYMSCRHACHVHV